MINKANIKLRALIYLFSYCWPVLIGILLVFLSLNVSDQGLDLIIQLGTKESYYDFTKFVLSISIFAFCNWYLTKLSFSNEAKNRISLTAKGSLKNIKVEPYDEFNMAFITEIRELHILFPKILAFLTITIVGSSLINSGVFKNVLYSKYILIVFVILNLVIIYKSKDLKNFIIKNKKYSLLFIFVLILLFLISYNPTNYGTIKYLYYFVNIFSLASLVFILLILRPILSELIPDSSNLFLNIIAKIIQNDKFENKKTHTFFSFNSIMVIVLVAINLLHISNNAIQGLANFIGPIPVLISGVISIMTILNFSNNLIKRNYFAFVIVFLLVSILSYSLPKNKLYFHIRVKESKVNIDERITLNDYLKTRLFKKFETNRDSSEIILISSYGGGIRAAYWTNLVLAKAMEKDTSFYNNCFSLCGASGGMIGLGIFNAVGNEIIKSKHKDIFNLYKKRDFLSSNLAKLLGKDLVLSILPFKSELRDRHNSIEDDLSTNFNSFNYSFNLNKNYLSNWYDSEQNFNYNKPILISTSTAMNRGIPAIYSPVRLKSVNFGLHYDVYKEVQIMREYYKTSKNWDVPYITAICQSARFPFVSPAGHFNEDEQFIDAGYYDNMGGEFTYNIANLISDYIDSLKTVKPTIYSKAKIKILIISSSTKNQFDFYKKKNELLVPFHGFFSTWEGHTINFDFKLKNLGISDKNIKVVKIELNNLNLEKEGEKFVFPLGWCLSQEAHEEMYNKSQNIDFNKKYE